MYIWKLSLAFLRIKLVQGGSCNIVQHVRVRVQYTKYICILSTLLTHASRPPSIPPPLRFPRFPPLPLSLCDRTFAFRLLLTLRSCVLYVYTVYIHFYIHNVHYIDPSSSYPTLFIHVCTNSTVYKLTFSNQN